MDEITNEKRERLYRESGESIQNLYAGAPTGKALRNIFDVFHLDERLYGEFAQIAGDVILGLHDTADITQLLENKLGVNNQTATAMSTALDTALKKLKGGTNSDQPPPPKKAPEAGSWGHFTSNVPEQGDTNRTPSIPQYQKPLTDTPRYRE